jgi:hypothetical protein
MNAWSDRELQEWMQVWRSGVEPQASPQSIYRHVVRRSRLFRLWVAIELAIVAGAYALLAAAFVARPDPLDRTAIAALVLISTAALALSWRTWRGMLRTPGHTTAAWLAQALERTRRLRRGITGGWWLLAAELAVFIPWIGSRLRSHGVGSVAAWGLLAVLTAIVVGFLLVANRWVRRETETLERIGRELEDD